MAEFKVRGVRRGPSIRPRTIVTAVIVVALLVVAWTQRAAIAQVVDAVRKGVLEAIIAAAVFEGLRIVCHAYAYTRAFRVIGGHVPLRATIPAWFKACFMNTVVPSGGTSGLAAVIDTARSFGVPVGSATTATLFTQTCFYLSMFLAVLVGFVVMAASGTLQAKTVLIGSIMGIAALAFVALLAMGHLMPGTLQRVMRRVERLVVRVLSKLHVKKLPKPWADELVHSFSTAATELVRKPKLSLAVFLAMLAAVFFDALCFVASGFAFGISRPDALFAGYVTAIVFNSFNVTPGGVGIVEGLAAVMLTGYGYPMSLALSTVLVYRACMYWVPLLVGGVMMRVTGAFGTGEQANGAAEKPHRAPASVGEVAAGVREAAHAAATRIAAVDDEGAPVYVRRRRSTATLRERVAAVVGRSGGPRVIVCCAVVLATGVLGMAMAPQTCDPIMVDVMGQTIFRALPIDPIAMVVFSYLLVGSVPLLLMRNQGGWIFTMMCLLGLGICTALSGHSVWVVAAVVASLTVLVVCHASFAERGFFRRLPRLATLVVYGMFVALAYALIGALTVRGDLAPDPGMGGALWMGLQALVTKPQLEGVTIGEQAAWFCASARAVTFTFTAAVAYLACVATVRRTIEWRRVENRAARDEARRQADEAARQRRQQARRGRQNRLGELAGRVAGGAHAVWETLHDEAVRKAGQLRDRLAPKGDETADAGEMAEVSVPDESSETAEASEAAESSETAEASVPADVSEAAESGVPADTSVPDESDSAR